MDRMFAGAFLLLAVLSPARVVASPPEVASGKLVYSTDKVAEALRRYQTTRNADVRAALLRKLSTSRDCRVLNAIGEALNDREQIVRFEAARLLVTALLLDGEPDEDLKAADEQLMQAAKGLWRQYQREQQLAAEKARRRASKLPQ